MSKPKVREVVAQNNKTKKIHYVQLVGIQDIPNTPLFINVTLGYEDEEKKRYTLSHKHTGWGIRELGAVTKKSAIEYATRFYSLLPEEIRSVLDNENLDASEVQPKLSELMEDYKIKVSFGIAKAQADRLLKSSK